MSSPGVGKCDAYAKATTEVNIASKPSVAQQVESLDITEDVGSQYRKLI